MLCLVKTVVQAGDGIPGRFIRVFAKTKREYEISRAISTDRSPAVMATLPFSARVYSQVIWLCAFKSCQPSDEPT